MVRATLAACAVFVLAAHAQDLPKAHRVALVIANSNYANLRPLPNAAKDADAISAALKQAGFEVVRIDDFKLTKFFTVDEAEFENHLKGGDVCLIYYAGYAVKAGIDNYLLPVDFDPQSQADWNDRAYLFFKFSETLEAKNVALRIFLLEGPPPLGANVAGLAGIGLADPQIGETKTEETYFISGTRPGNTVPPAPAGNVDLLTRQAAKAINELKLPVEQLFDQVILDVTAASDATGQRQLPYHATSLKKYRKFYFHEPEKVSTPDPVIIKTPPPEWPRPGIPVQNTRDKEEYTWIKAQSIMMGCVPGGEKPCTPAEQPRHEISLSHGFWLGRNEVQVDSYKRYVEQVKEADKQSKLKMPTAPLYERHWNNASYPMVNVKWEEAKAYCEWAGGRLPTEAEWETAARGGKKDEIYPMNTVGSRDSANFYGKSGNDIYDDIVAPVRKFIGNSYGLFDMAGNVWEWVSDFFAPYPGNRALKDPTGPSTGKEHVIRGGSYDSDPKEHLRISYRRGTGKEGQNIGFRCAIDDTPATRKLLPQPATSQ